MILRARCVVILVQGWLWLNFKLKVTVGGCQRVSQLEKHQFVMNVRAPKASIECTPVGEWIGKPMVVLAV